MATVLLVEDDQWLGELYTKLLQKNGLRVFVERDAQAAMDRLDQATPDVVVLDLLLPGANGLAFLHELASHPDLSTIPVVLCSNALQPGMHEQDLQQYGVVSVVDKTTARPKQLLRAVRGALAHARLPN